jgi:hypothetical protein
LAVVERGEVHFLTLDLPDWETGGVATHEVGKLVVILRTTQPGDSYAPVVLVSTDNRNLDQPLQAFEVSVGPEHGFHEDSLIDCRWVFSLALVRFNLGTWRFALYPFNLEEISDALMIGLEIVV